MHIKLKIAIIIIFEVKWGLYNQGNRITGGRISERLL